MRDDSELDTVDRRVRLIIIASAAILLLEGALILAAAAPKPSAERLGTQDDAPPDSESKTSAKAGRALELDDLKRMTPEKAALEAIRWTRSKAKNGSITNGDVAEILPEAAFFLARTASLSDVDDIRASADGSSAFSRAYEPVARIMPGSNAAGKRVEAALDVIYGFRTGSAATGSDTATPKMYPPLPRDARWITSREKLKWTHQNALDIFFYGASGRGASETGPMIRSMSTGMVVAMANDWVGGEGPGKYRHGGLTPRAGNGVIVYDPNSRKYYTYLHLHDVVVVPGQIVSPGTPLGHGGNTGTNARKRGHGGHLHLEIFDAVKDDTLSCYELREIILSLRP